MPEIIYEGQTYRTVDIIATGEWQLLQMKKHQCYILVHPNGRQAWFHENDMSAAVRRLGSKFRYTDKPMADLRRLAKAGLRPFHVDADFNVLDFTRPH